MTVQEIKNVLHASLLEEGVTITYEGKEILFTTDFGKHVLAFTNTGLVFGSQQSISLYLKYDDIYYIAYTSGALEFVSVIGSVIRIHVHK